MWKIFSVFYGQGNTCTLLISLHFLSILSFNPHLICYINWAAYLILLSYFISALTSANLTGHVERVGIENFELLKVLGTGGE